MVSYAHTILLPLFNIIIKGPAQYEISSTLALSFNVIHKCGEINI